VAVGVSVRVGVRLGTGVRVEVPVGAGTVGVGAGEGERVGAERQPVRRASESTTKVRRFIGNAFLTPQEDITLRSITRPSSAQKGILKVSFF
jgi:hypothetical protein